MNIIVCLKQVPGTTKVEIDPTTNTLVRQGIKNVVNPNDTYALEEGIRLKERYGGKVTALSMGPPQAEEILREAIAKGADEAILLSDRAFAGADTLATAYTLSRAITRTKDCDLIICGRQTVDGDTGQVAPELAELLGLPFVSYVNKVEQVAAGQMRLQRMIDEGHEIIETFLPVVISVIKDINVPRLPSLRGIARATNTTITVLTAQDIDLDTNMVGLAGSPTKVAKIFSPERVRRAEQLQGGLEEQVTSLIEILRQARII